MDTHTWKKMNCFKVPIIVLFGAILGKSINAQSFSFEIVSSLTNIQMILMRMGPVLSALLFVVAGIVYAVGQLFPSMKRASFHTAAVDIIIGAIVVAVLSVASTSLAVASTQILSNFTVNSL